MTRASVTLSLLLPLLLAAQLVPLEAGVFRWRDAKPLQRDGRTERAIMSGSTLDLARLDVRAVTLGPKRATTYYLFTYLSKAPPDVGRGMIAGGSFLVDWNDLEVKRNATGMRRDVFDRPTAMFRRFTGAGPTEYFAIQGQ
ncbi:MAG: hypothetical protein ABI664_07605 [bacterium]